MPTTTAEQEILHQALQLPATWGEPRRAHRKSRCGAPYELQASTGVTGKAPFHSPPARTFPVRRDMFSEAELSQTLHLLQASWRGRRGPVPAHLPAWQRHQLALWAAPELSQQASHLCIRWTRQDWHGHAYLLIFENQATKMRPLAR